MSVGCTKRFTEEGKYQRNQLDVWFLYLLRAPVPTTGLEFVKVGISSEPFWRLHNISTTIPVYIETCMFAVVGGVGLARKIEARIKKMFEGQGTRGEWGMMLSTSWPDFFHKAEVAYAHHRAAAPKWRELTYEDLRAGATATRVVESAMISTS